MLCKRLTIAGTLGRVPQSCPRGLSIPPLECKQASRLNESMASRESALIDITPEVLLKAYSCGIFPMAESADDPALYWIEPERRGIIPLDRFHLPGRLARTVRSSRYTVIVDHTHLDQ
jgi:Leu/Phe-tRNA-protein transferase